MAATDAQVTALAREGRTRRLRPLPPRRARTEAFVGGSFVVAAVLLAVLGDAERAFSVGPALGLVLLFIAGMRVQIDIGVAYTAPVQLAFVAMLLLVSTPFVPLLVLIGWFVGRLPDLRGPEGIHPDRLLQTPGDCWFAIGPAVVLIAGDAQTPDWDNWPIYLAALGSQFAVEAVSSIIREWVGEGATPASVVRELRVIWGIDALLSPLGVLAAFASESWQYAFLLLVPPAGLLGFYAHERTRRISNALALADAAKQREELIANASHELVTPLAVLVGLSGRLASGRPLTPERRTQIDAVMAREVVAMRQLVRQFVDYTRLKTERNLRLELAPVALEPVAAEIVTALAATGQVTLLIPPDLPEVLADHDRLHQMLMSFALDVIRSTPGAPVARISATGGDSDVTIVVEGDAPVAATAFEERAEGASAGIGLYVTRQLALAHGGDARVDPEAGRYTFTLRRAV